VAVAEAPAAPKLSPQTEKVLSHVPSHIDTVPKGKTTNIALDRTSPAAQSLVLDKKDKVDSYEAAGIKIAVRRPGLDTNFELNRAFTALEGGDSSTAIEIYKNILSVEPTNQDALFALASIYHRQGQFDKARPLYASLIDHYPNNRAGLSNFLALVADESPQEALAELERLEQRNPDFSPIPAQEAIVLHKLGYVPEASDTMLRAIELAPDILTYKYNLAILLDGAGDYAGAADLYRLLIDASMRGAAIPAPAATLQKRLNFIATATTSAQANATPIVQPPLAH
jgi:tetratricopeptide (TPR) repeat protein